MARRLDAALELLDRQLVDKDGRLAGKVDDLELTDPGDILEQPRVTAILTGPDALAGRLHTRFGRWLQGVVLRLLARQAPSRVPLGQVEAIGSSIRLRVAAGRLDTGQGWTRQLVSWLPGAGDAVTGLAHDSGVRPDRHQGSRGLGTTRVPLGDLLGAEVVDQHGRAVGKVHDVRLEQAGPELASLRVEGLIVGRRALGARFGFGRGVRGPSLLRLVFGSLGHDGRYVAWRRIRSIRDRQIRIAGTADDLPAPQPSGD
jgi:sporulation protein YlmC with PRC-barrel domain